jgi:hypothetical protein
MSSSPEYRLQYYREHKEELDRKQHERTLKRKYGVTPDIYEAYLEFQEYSCAICGTHQSKISRKLSVDHDHRTGVVRGLLCYRCNSILGLSNDSIDTLKRAIDYLVERSEIHEKQS